MNIDTLDLQFSRFATMPWKIYGEYYINLISSLDLGK